MKNADVLLTWLITSLYLLIAVMLVLAAPVSTTSDRSPPAPVSSIRRR
jgi:cytochrome c oxidase assembly factor CtaG